MAGDGADVFIDSREVRSVNTWRRLVTYP